VKTITKSLTMYITSHHVTTVSGPVSQYCSYAPLSLYQSISETINKPVTPIELWALPSPNLFRTSEYERRIEIARYCSLLVRLSDLPSSPEVEEARNHCRAIILLEYQKQPQNVLVSRILMEQNVNHFRANELHVRQYERRSMDKIRRIIEECKNTQNIKHLYTMF
jgi:hypothetical protein